MGRVLFRGGATALVALVVGPAATAVATPTVTIERPSSGTLNTPTPTFGGLAEEIGGEVTLTIYGGEKAEGIAVETLTTSAALLGGAWEVAATHLDDGTYTARATQPNLLMETGESASVTFTVDTASPTVTLNPPESPSKDTTPSFTGSAGETTTPVVVHIYNSLEVEVSSATASGTGGAWTSADASPPLPSGEYTARATQASSIGNPEGRSGFVTFTVDTASPTVTLNKPESPSKDTTPSFTGSASETSTPVVVHIYNSLEVEVSSATAAGTGGGWTSADASPPLASGEYTARATQASSLGNPEGKSTLANFTVDTAPPTVSLPPIASPTNDTEPTFSGAAGNAPGDISTVTLKIYSGETASGTPISTVKVTAVGTTWTAVATESLTEGTYTAQAVQSDEAGNVGTATSIFTIKTKGPAVSLSSVASPTNSPIPSFSGGAGVAPGDIAAVTLDIYSGDSASGGPIRTMAVTPSGATWNAKLPVAEALPEGTYTAQAEQSDKAGNTTKSASSTFTVDTTTPAMSLTPIASPTNDSAPSFGGNAGVAPGDIKSVTLKIYSGEGASGGAIQTVNLTPSDATWSTSLTQPLNDGTYTAQAEQSDEAGNTTRSTPSTFAVDTVAPGVSLTPVAALTNDPKPSFLGGTGVAPGDIASVTLNIYSGEGASGTPIRSVPVTPTGGTWSTSIAESLPDGTYTAQAEQSDAAGNVGKSGGSIFTVDATPPAVSLSPVSTPTNNPDPSFSGNAGAASGDNASVTLKLYSGGSASGTPIQTLSATASGTTWKATLTVTEALPEGTYTAQAEQSDKAGNMGKSATSTFAIYTKPPPLSLSPVASPTNNSKPSFTGAAGDEPLDIPSVILKIYAGASTSGTLIKAVTVTPSGTAWSTSLTQAVNDGTYTAQAEQSDKVGNTTKSAPSTFTVDTTPPAVSLTSAPALTDNPTPSFSGGGGVAPGDIAPVTLKIYSGNSASGTPIRTVPVTPTGSTWTASIAEALLEGTYTAQAEQSDEAKNTGKSATSTFTVDTTAPSVTLNAIAPFTSDTTPAFSGNAGTASQDIASVTLNIYSGEGVSGTPIQTVTVAPTGAAWSTGVAAALVEGTYTAQAQQSDQAGNIGKSAPSVFTIKTKGPALSLSPVAVVTNNPKPSFSGVAGVAPGDTASITLKIYTGSTTTGTLVRSIPVVPSAATWQGSVAEALSDGTYNAQAEQFDEAGNATKSARSIFTVDTRPPAVTVTTPANGAELTKSRLTFSGAAGTATVPGTPDEDLPTITLKVFVGTSPSGAPLQTLPVTAKGATWSTRSAGTELQLPNGTYTALVEQSDAAGNIGTSQTTFKIKTNSPVVTFDSAAFVARGSGPGATLFTDATPAFTGSASAGSEDGKTVTLRIYAGGSASGTPVQTVEATLIGETWTAGPVAALSEGGYTVQAEQADKSLNTQPGVSAPVAFSVDATPPQVTLTSPANGSSTGGESELVAGVAGSAEGDLPTVTVQLFSGSRITEGQSPIQSIAVKASAGTWAATFAGLAPGTYTARAERSDDTGNVGVSAPTTFLITGSPSLAASGQGRTPPVASFTWFPTSPHPGEPISLASSSTDATSPITAFAWDLTGTSVLTPGGQVMKTTFATPGNHVVKLRVADADGLSSVASETIPVTVTPIRLMQPFPVVRIVSTDTASGIRLKLLRVQAPAGAKVGVECKGHGCPARSESRIAAAGKVGVAPVEFRRFDRSLRAGIVLEIRVSKAGEIGKFTSFYVRRRRLPARVDACLGPAGVKPIACP